jgi:aspartyl-tRNA(Asn)/glutamyl-tRNA(Gln) amidotransferase subunit C
MINKKEIKKIAALAKIEISEDEMEKYSDQISKILEYMSTLNEVDTSNVEEFSNQLLNDSQNIREDNPEESLKREDVINLAPESDGIHLKVPKIINDDES